MALKQPELVRRKVVGFLHALKIWLSATGDVDAWTQLHGDQGTKNAAEITELIVGKLGHPPSNMGRERDNPNLKAARKGL